MKKDDRESRGPSIKSTAQPELSTREVEILALVAIGATDEEIGDKLKLSPDETETHINQIFRKIDVHNRLQAALWAAKKLWINGEDAD